MAQKHTLEELNNCSREELITIVLMMQGQLDTLNDNIEKLIERKRQTMRQSLKSTPPIIGDVASCIRPEDYLTMA